jgi:hypothetical protein
MKAVQPGSTSKAKEKRRGRMAVRSAAHRTTSSSSSSQELQLSHGLSDNKRKNTKNTLLNTPTDTRSF